MSISCFLIVIDPIFKIFKNLLNGSSGFPSPHNFQSFPKISSEISRFPSIISYGLRPLPPAPDICILGLQILGIVASGSWHSLVHQLVIFASLAFCGTLETTTRDTLRFRPGFLLISGAFCCPWLLFGCLVLLFWHPGGPWGDLGTILGRSWDIGGHKEGPCELQA